MEPFYVKLYVKSFVCDHGTFVWTPAKTVLCPSMPKVFEALLKFAPWQ